MPLFDDLNSQFETYRATTDVLMEGEALYKINALLHDSLYSYPRPVEAERDTAKVDIRSFIARLEPLAVTDVTGRVDLALALCKGRLADDPAKALADIEKAAAKGNKFGIFYKAEIHIENGEFAEGLPLLVSLGSFAPALGALAKMYQDGKGVARDLVQAKALYEQALALPYPHDHMDRVALTRLEISMINNELAKEGGGAAASGGSGSTPAASHAGVFAATAWQGGGAAAGGAGGRSTSDSTTADASVTPTD